jgi:ABC-type transporter Mla subunit MlaD
MNANTASFRVGAFILAGALALLALLFILSGSRLRQGTPFETYFQESVQGLDVGTAVKFHGVTIGQVSDIGLVNAEYPAPANTPTSDKAYQQVVVRFNVNPDKLGKGVDTHKVLASAVANGLRAQIKPQGITGLSYIDLSFANPLTFPASKVPWTPDSMVIPSMPSTLTQVQDAAEKVMSSLSQVDLAKITTQISQLVATLNEEVTTGDAHQAVASARQLLATLNTAVQQSNLPATTASIRTLADGPQTQQILAQLNQTTVQLAKISSQLPTLIATSQTAINHANETTADVQSQMLPILQNMKTTTDNLRDLSATLAANPGQVILGAPPPPEGTK